MEKEDFRNLPALQLCEVVIKHIPNALDKSNRTEWLKPYKYQTVEYWCKETVGSTSGLICVINGKVLDNFDYVPAIGDEIIFIQDLQGKGSIISGVLNVLMIVVGVILWATPFGVPLVIAGVAGLAGTLLTALIGTPKTQPFGTDSATYSWDGVQNTIGEGNIVPVVYGRHRQGGILIETFIDGGEAQGVQQKKYLNALVALSEGEIWGLETDSIKINNNELSSYEKDVEYWTVNGTNNQLPLPNFSRITRHYIQTSIIKLTRLSGAYIYRTFNDSDMVIITIQCPALYASNDEGGMESNQIEFEGAIAEVSENPVWYSLANFVIKAKSKSTVEYDWRVSLPATGKYYIKFRRKTSDWDTNMGMEGSSYFKSATETTWASLAYPNTALMGIRLKATDKLSGAMPAITGIIKGKKVKDVRNLSAPASLSNYTNPANILYDLITNEVYGLGHYVSASQIHLDSFRIFAGWCDESIPYTYYDSMTGQDTIRYQKRYEMNIVIDKAYKAHELLHKIASTCRGLLFWSGDQIKIIIDAPQNTYSQVFSMGNIVADSFDETYIGLNNIPNQVDVVILDEENDYKKATICAVDKSRLDEIIPAKSVEMYGITDKARAKREAIFTMKRAKGMRRVIKFSTTVQALICEVGDLFLFQHDVPQYGWGGSIKSISGSVITLDCNILLQGGRQHRLRVRKLDGEFSLYTITPPVDAVASSIDIGFTVPSDIKVGDIWVFGEVNREAKPFRLISSVAKEDCTVELTAEEYNESVFNEDENIDVRDVHYSYIGLIESWQFNGLLNPNERPATNGELIPGGPDGYDIPPMVLDVSAYEELMLIGNVWQSTIVVNFGKVEMSENSLSRILYYEVIISDDEGETWNTDGKTDAVGSGYYRIMNVQPGATAPIWEADITYSKNDIVRIGRPEWSSIDSYSSGDKVIASDGSEYISLQSGNVNNEPETAYTWWEKVATMYFRSVVDYNEELNPEIESDYWDTCPSPEKVYYVHVKPYTNYGMTNHIELSDHALDNRVVVRGDDEAPAALTGFDVVGRTFVNECSWTAPLEVDFSHAEIWCCAGTNDRSMASMVGTTKGIVFKHTALYQGEDYYYWVRAVDTKGNKSNFTPENPLGGLCCSPSNDPSMVIDLLNNSISAGQFTNDLKARIDTIDAPDTGLLALVDDLTDNFGVLDGTINNPANGVVSQLGNLGISVQDFIQQQAQWFAALERERAISDATIEIDPATGQIRLIAMAEITTDIEARISSVETDMNAAEGSISSHTTQITAIDGELEAVNTEITQMQGEIALKVSSGYVDFAVNGLAALIDPEALEEFQDNIPDSLINLSLIANDARNINRVNHANIAQAQFDIQANSNAISAEAEARLVLAALVNGNAAALISEQTARATADSAETTARLALQAKTANDIAAAVLVEQNARTAADSAEASARTTLAARVSTSEAAIVTEQNARINADSAEANARIALASRMSTAEAAITTEQSTRAAADAAEASARTTLATRVGNAESAIITEQNVRASADSAEAAARALLTTRIGNAEAAIVTEQNARASADSAEVTARGLLAARLTTAEGDIDTNIAAISTEQSARIAADSAEATARINLGARVDTTESNISQINTVTSASTSAVARAVAAAQVTLGENTAAIQQEMSVRAKAIAPDYDPLETYLIDATVAYDGKIYRCNTACPGGMWSLSYWTEIAVDLYAQYTLKTDVNGYVAGFGLANGGEGNSQFIVLADKFAVVMPGKAGVIPFSVGLVRGQSTVGISGDLVVDGTIGANAIKCDELVVGDNIAMGPNAVITWGKVGGKPNNVNSLAGTEAITNTSITIDANGVLQGVGTPGIGVNNAKQAWSQVNSKPYNLSVLNGAENINNASISVDGNGMLTGTSAVSVIVNNAMQQWAQVAGRPNTTYIGPTGIYTGSLNCNQLTAGTIVADQIFANAVTTSKIMGNAVTVTATARTAVSLDCYGVGNVQQVTINASGNFPIVIFFSASMFVDQPIGGQYNLSNAALYRGSTRLVLIDGSRFPASATADGSSSYYAKINEFFIDIPATAGQYTYYFKVSDGWSNLWTQTSERQMFAMEVKR